MDKGISSSIRRILTNWNTISDVMDKIQVENPNELTIMQTISRMKKNGEVVSKEIDLIGRTIHSYKMKSHLGSAIHEENNN